MAAQIGTQVDQYLLSEGDLFPQSSGSSSPEIYAVRLSESSVHSLQQLMTSASKTTPPEQSHTAGATVLLQSVSPFGGLFVLLLIHLSDHLTGTRYSAQLSITEAH